jgi:hypothetical protein
LDYPGKEKIMTNIIGYLTMPILLSVHTNDWFDIGYQVGYVPVSYTNYHQMQIVESNWSVTLPATNAIGVPFVYELNLAQTVSTNRRYSTVPASLLSVKSPSMAGSMQVHRLQIHKISMPPLP